MSIDIVQEVWHLNDEVKDRFRAVRNLCRGTTVLDVGCRDGTFGIWMARQGYHVTGWDTDASAIDAANAMAVRLEVNAVFFAKDLYKAHPSEGGQDVVVCMETLEHVPDPARAMEILLSLPKPGGSLVITVPANTHISDPDHKNTFYREAVVRAFPDAEWSKTCPVRWLCFRIRRPKP